MTLPPDTADFNPGRFNADDPGRFDMDVRVRYCECDPMNVVHHSIYPVWMEMARCEMLRQVGLPYDELEARGVLFVVARLSIRYRRPAKFGDVVTLQTRVTEAGKAKIDHGYELIRDGVQLMTAETTLVCVDREGRLQTVPDVLLDSPSG